MLNSTAGSGLPNLWDKDRAAGMSEQELLLYRSNLLGSDKRVTNYGGGNTSAKVMETDPLTGEGVEVLWVKGSGGDVGTIKMDGFATLYMEKLNALKGLYRGVEFEDEMVGYLPHCTFKLNPRAASIDTPLHAYVPKRHVDHMHPDAIIAIAASANSKELTAKIFGDEIGWLPWKRPGFELASGWKNSAAKTRMRKASFWKVTACSPGPIRRRPATRRRSTSSIAPLAGSRIKPVRRLYLAAKNTKPWKTMSAAASLAP